MYMLGEADIFVKKALQNIMVSEINMVIQTILQR